MNSAQGHAPRSVTVHSQHLPGSGMLLLPQAVADVGFPGAGWSLGHSVPSGTLPFWPTMCAIVTTRFGGLQTSSGKVSLKAFLIGEVVTRS